MSHPMQCEECQIGKCNRHENIICEWGGTLRVNTCDGIRNVAEILNEKECEEKGHMFTWMPKGKSLCMRCGILV